MSLVDELKKKLEEKGEVTLGLPETVKLCISLYETQVQMFQRKGLALITLDDGKDDAKELATPLLENTEKVMSSIDELIKIFMRRDKKSLKDAIPHLEICENLKPIIEETVSKLVPMAIMQLMASMLEEGDSEGVGNLLSGLASLQEEGDETADHLIKKAAEQMPS